MQFEALAERVNSDPVLRHRGRFLNLDFLLVAGAQGHLIRIRGGEIAEVADSGDKDGAFTISADADAWSEFCAVVPRPGYQDVMAMLAVGAAWIEGDLQPLFTNMLYIKGLLAALRPAGGGQP